MPFKNLFNEWFARDTSKKIRAVLRAKAQRGEKIATRAPYGYMKDPENPKRIIPNPDTAPIVKKIFQLCVEGSGPMQIAKQLKRESILTSLGYEYVTTGKTPSNWNPSRLYDWAQKSVKRILENIAYSGLVVCGDCGSNMVLHRAKSMQKSQYNFACGLYKKQGKDICTAHFIREEALEKILLEDIRRVTLFARNREAEFAEKIRLSTNDEAKQKLSAAQKELSRQLSRQNELNAIFKRLYEDHVMGRITSEQFRLLSADYTAEQAGLAEAIPLFEEKIQGLKDTALDISRFIAKAKKFVDITELTPEILHTFVSKIVVHERSEKYSRNATQKIEIHYTHIRTLQIIFDNVDYINEEDIRDVKEKQTA